MSHRLIRDAIAARKPLVAAAKTPVADAARLMKKHDVGALMIVDAGRLTGIFTERDALFASSRKRATRRRRSSPTS